MNAHEQPRKGANYFKQIFRGEDPALFSSFLAALLGRPEAELLNLSFEPDGPLPDLPGGWPEPLNARIKTPKGSDVFVAVRFFLQDIPGLAQQMTFDTIRMYSRSNREVDRLGKPYEIQVVNIAILDFRLFDDEKAQHTFKLLEEQSKSELTEGVRIDYLELPKAAAGFPF